MTAYRRFAWAVLAYNLLVIAWGAFVRATGSGAGCGNHWPLCNGQVLPRAPALETAIEFGHRATSGLAALLVAALVAWAVRTFPAGHAARRAAWAAAGLMVAEALAGAGLVLFGWVAKDASAARGWVVALHLTLTFLLLAALALSAALAEARAGLVFAGRSQVLAPLGLALATVVVTGATGAIAALGDTLFPAVSFAEGLRQETHAGAEALLRLRVVHPFAALAAAVAVAVAARAALRARPEPRVQRRATAVAALLGTELCAGALNVALLAPLWLQLVHLLVADALWVALVLLAAAALAPEARAEAPPATAAAAAR